MVLLCGIPSESPLVAVQDALDQLGEDVLIFSQRRFQEASLEWSVRHGRVSGFLTYNGTAYNIEQFKGVYVRLMSEEALPEFKSAEDDRVRMYCRELHRSLYHWIEVAQTRVVNRISTSASNSSKPFQAQIISKFGFSIPPTLITTSPEAVASFRKKHKRIIFKSLSGVRSIVKEFDDEDWQRIESIRFCPVQFQAKIEGFDVRAHVVDNEVFATRIVSDATDYRYAKQDGLTTDLVAFQIDDKVEAACVELTRALNLHFSGIDLKYGTDGKIYCFEVNPMPGFTYYESNTGQPISLALAKFLAYGSAC